MNKEKALEYLQKENKSDVYYCPICNREADRQHLIESFENHPSLLEMIDDLKQKGVKSLVEWNEKTN